MRDIDPTDAMIEALYEKCAVFHYHGLNDEEITAIWRAIQEVAAHPVTTDAGEGADQQAKERIANAGYVRAFYELAALMGLNARSSSPREVWEQEMRPRLERALSAQSRPLEGEVADEPRDEPTLEEAVCGLRGWLSAGEAFQRQGGSILPLDGKVRALIAEYDFRRGSIFFDTDHHPSAAHLERVLDAVQSELGDDLIGADLTVLYSFFRPSPPPATLQPHDTGYAKAVRDAAAVAGRMRSVADAVLQEKHDDDAAVQFDVADEIQKAILALLPRDSTARVGEADHG